MDRDRAVTIIQQQLGFTSLHSTDIVSYLQDAQEQLERNWPFRPLPWWLLTERASTSTEGNEERVEVPADFIEEYELDGIWLVDDNGGEHLLRKYDVDDLRELQQQRTGYNTYDTSATDIPTHYALTGVYYRLIPAPTKVYTLKQIYYGTDAVLSSGGTENGWLKYGAYVLIGHAGERIASARRDMHAMGVFQSWKAAAMTSLEIQIVERVNANRRYAMGETL